MIKDNLKFCIIFLLGIVSCNNNITTNYEDLVVDSDLSVVDVHGAGAQRSDPKSGDPDSFPEGHGPQGDIVRIYNYIRPVRDFSSTTENYTIVDTGQVLFFDNTTQITEPNINSEFYRQDVSVAMNDSNYTKLPFMNFDD